MKSFRSKSKQGIILLMASFLVCLLGVTTMVHALGTPAGTDIDNQATVNYQDAGLNNYVANSNTVTTTVNAVYSVALDSPVDKSWAAGSSDYYYYTVTNTSNTNDTITMAAVSEATLPDWAVSLVLDDGVGVGSIAGNGIKEPNEVTPYPGPGVSLGPDATLGFFAVVTIPGGTANGTTDDTITTATGTGGNDPDTVTSTASAPAITIVKSVINASVVGPAETHPQVATNADPGQILEYRLTVTNAAGAAAAVNIVLTDNNTPFTTYRTGEMWIGADDDNAPLNTAQDDDDAGGVACVADACGHGSVDGTGNVTAYLGTGSNETGGGGTGGSLAPGSTVYIFFRVDVD